MANFTELAPQLIDLSQIDLNDSCQVRKGGTKIEDLILYDEFPEEIDLESNLGAAALKRLQILYERFETNLEYKFADKVISRNADDTDYMLYERFVRLIQAESSLSAMASSKRVLFIGSGPFPISPILFSNLVGAEVDCYDKSEEACVTSRQVIDQLGLTGRVNILNVSGENGLVNNYDAVIIALLAQPKDQILNNIWKNITDDTKVICRTSEGIRRIFYRETAPNTYPQYSVIGLHRAGMDDTISSLLLGRGK